MPTVLRVGSYRFYFCGHEPNEPPHVNIDRDDSTAKFWLEWISLAKTIGFGAKELRKLQGIVQENQELLWEAWHEYFGDSSGRKS